MAGAATLNLDAFTRDGFHSFGNVIDAASASAIHDKARTFRVFGPELFSSEQEYNANPQHWGVNPRDGRNFIERFSDELRCIEQHPLLHGALTQMLGSGYQVHNKKFVCAIPDDWLPPYLLRIASDTAINNLGAFIRPEFRDITYFRGIDFHQDVIDWPAWQPEKKTHQFLTLYVYIHEVTAHDAPLIVLPGSHRFGATRFPHTLRFLGDGHWHYEDGSGRSMDCAQRVLTGSTGNASLWHSCLLHGTEQRAVGGCRLSLRYILQRAAGENPVGLDTLNADVTGPLYLDQSRVDLDASGKVVLPSGDTNSPSQTSHPKIQR
jgi:ureidoglycolate hydrolase